MKTQQAKNQPSDMFVPMNVLYWNHIEVKYDYWWLGLFFFIFLGIVKQQLIGLNMFSFWDS